MDCSNNDFQWFEWFKVLDVHVDTILWMDLYKWFNWISKTDKNKILNLFFYHIWYEYWTNKFTEN